MIGINSDDQNIHDLLNSPHNNFDSDNKRTGFWILHQTDTLTRYKYSVVAVVFDDDENPIDTMAYLDDAGPFPCIINSIFQIGYYSNGLRDSTWHIYDTNLDNPPCNEINIGTILYIAEFNNGILNGLLKTFRRDQSLRSETIFKDGKLNGYVKSYSANGKIKFEGYYDREKDFLYGKSYDDEGYFIREGTFNIEMIQKDLFELNDLNSRIDENKGADKP